MLEGPVLLLDARMPVAFVLADRLRSAGLEVVAADTYAVPGWTDRGQACEVVPSPVRYRAEHQDRVEALCRAARVRTVLPVLESGLHLTDLEGTELFAPPPHLGQALHDKARFAELARAAGVSTPRQRHEVGDDEAAAIEWVVRPRFGRGGIGTAIVAADALDATRPDPATHVVTERIPGREVATLSVVERGELVAHVAYAHDPAAESDGATVIARLDDGLGRSEATALIRSTGLVQGCFGLDLLGDPGRPLVVECNPRPTIGALLLEVDPHRGWRASGSAARIEAAELRRWTTGWRGVEDIAHSGRRDGAHLSIEPAP